ncbi:MAG TPA: M24 family metallopeptidase [Acidimicrobiales bacterium]|nr:M24 family metallopeptidase [Acidimicrobiales bacterium]
MVTDASRAESSFDPELVTLLEQEYPRFSETEIDRRRRGVEQLMSSNDVTHLLIYGIGGRGGAVTWLSQWLVTNEAQLVVTSLERDALFVQYFNHVPLATKIARDASVRWGGPSTIASSIEELRRRGATEGSVGVIGPLPFGAARALEEVFGRVVDLNAGYHRLRLIKSSEELVWFRLGARLADLSIDALATQLRPGLSERDLVGVVESAYHSYGGVNGIHYFALNAMSDPQYCVPRQHPSTRLVRRGDVLSTEITTNFFDYGGQVLRTFSVDEELSPLFRELHDVADAAYQAMVQLLVPGTHVAQLVEAARVIEDAGFTTFDDLVHGYGGGYLAPILGSLSRANEPVPDMVLEEGMMLVVQPNVVTTDHRAGVQTGECLVVTGGGPARLHTSPQGARRVGA